MSASTSRRPLPAIAFLLLLSILTVIVWWRVLHRPDAASEGAGTSTSHSATCSSAAKPVSPLPSPGAVTVNVRNGAGRDQLATKVTNELKSRGFKVGQPGDAGSPLAGTAEIRYGAVGEPGATLLSYYLPGAKLVTIKRSDKNLDLILGSSFDSLASSTTVSKAVAKATKAC